MELSADATLSEVALITVTYQSEALAAFYAETARFFPNAWVVDNASSDRTTEAFASAVPHASVIKLPTNVGFGAANNVGFRESVAKCRYALFLNPDCRISPDCVRRLVETLQTHPSALLACPVIFDQHGRAPGIKIRDYSKGFAHKHVDNLAYAAELPEFIEDTCLDGSCFLVDSSRFLEIGAFNDNIFMYFEEDDVGLRIAQHGYRAVTNTRSHATHLAGASSKKSLRTDLRKSYSYRWSAYFMTQTHIGTGNRLLDVVKTLMIAPWAVIFYTLLLQRRRGVKWAGWLMASVDGLFMTRIFRAMI